MSNPSRRVLLGGLGATGLAALGRPARGATSTIRVGKSVGNLFADVPVDVGLDKGLFAKHDLTVTALTFNGAAKMYAALLSGAIDVALGSGPGMINIIRGIPAIAVAMTTGVPAEMTILVPYDSPVKTSDDLKGKHIGITSPGGVVEWTVRELSRVKGWGPDGITPVSIGGNEAGAAALKAHTVDGTVADAASGFRLEPEKIARPVAHATDFVTNFVDHAIFVSTAYVQSDPAGVRAFLAGWFDAVAYMRKNRADAVRIASAATGYDTTVIDREYDLMMPAMSSDGKFDRKGLAVVARSFVDLGMVPVPPDMTPLYTEVYLPKS